MPELISELTPESSPSMLSDPDAGPRRRRILVVEDELLVGMMLEDMIEDIGHRVAARAATIDAAVALVEAGGFDAAILDVQLAGRPVYPVADLLAGRGIPFAFATGYDSRGLIDRYCGHAALAKPYGRDELRRLLDRLLAGPVRSGPA